MITSILMSKWVFAPFALSLITILNRQQPGASVNVQSQGVNNAPSSISHYRKQLCVRL